MNAKLQLQYFDPKADFQIVERRLPHWSQPGAIAFITWRTNDSMPKAVLQQWLQDRACWLAKHAINPAEPQWRDELRRLPLPLVHQFYDTFDNRWHDALDQSHGQCVLRRPELAQEVAKSVRHFDGQRYLLLDFVVMPNHVHLLAAFPDEDAMLLQCESWKHFTATKINAALGRKGRFWQQDGFDHLVRSEEQLLYLRRYIEANPVRAELRAGEYIHYSKPLEGLAV